MPLDEEHFSSPGAIGLAQIKAAIHTPVAEHGLMMIHEGKCDACRLRVAFLVWCIKIHTGWTEQYLLGQDQQFSRLGKFPPRS